nr:uncharacterized protein [uncultured Mediterranean phage uvMED]
MSTLEVKAIQAPSGFELEMPTGHIVQVVSSTFTGTATGTQTTPTLPHADCSVSITPKKSTNKILITVHTHVMSNGNKHATVHLYKDSSELSGAKGANTAGNIRSATGSGYHSSSDLPTHGDLVMRPASMQFLDTAGSTSSIAYSFRARARSSGNTWFINRANNGSTTDDALMAPISTITVMEVQA